MLSSRGQLLHYMQDQQQSRLCLFTVSYVHKICAMSFCFFFDDFFKSLCWNSHGDSCIFQQPRPSPSQVVEKLHLWSSSTFLHKYTDIVLNSYTIEAQRSKAKSSGTEEVLRDQVKKNKMHFFILQLCQRQVQKSRGTVYINVYFVHALRIVSYLLPVRNVLSPFLTFELLVYWW